MSHFLMNHPIYLLLRRGWHYADRHRPAMMFYLVLFGLAQGVSLFEPYVIGQMLNALQTDVGHATKSGAQIWHDISINLWLFFWIQFVFWLFHGPGRVIERYVAFHIRANYKAHLFKVLTELPLQWHRQHHSGESIDKINRATNSLTTFFDNSFEVSYMLLRLVGSLTILFWFMPYAAWVALATTAAAFLNVYLFDRYLYDQYNQLNKFENKIASAVHDYVTNISSVITLRLENRVVREVKRRMQIALPLYKRNITIHEFKWFVTTMLIAAMTVAVMLHYAHTELAAGHALLGGTFFTLFEYLRRIGDSFYNFAGLYGNIVRQSADVESADTIVEAWKSTSETQIPGLPKDWRVIRIADLQFRYEDEKHRQHHLENVDIELQRGKSIALVGESGSGKSTLLSLLRGLQQADQATVQCDGIEMAGGLRHLMSHTTLIPQDPEIFADTIGFNINFGLDADHLAVAHAIEMSRFKPVLERLPNGLETNIAEKGVNLSGGEKQRLALARGVFFARESDILLMDEPTSSVDTLNERMIYGSVLSSYADKCIVSSIHKLHLLEMFDEIYVFSNGSLVEHGSFQALVDRGGKLASMWRNYQATGAAPDERIRDEQSCDAGFSDRHFDDELTAYALTSETTTEVTIPPIATPAFTGHVS